MSLTKIEEFKELQAQLKVLKSQSNKPENYDEGLELIQNQLVKCAKTLIESNSDFHDATYWLCYERVFGSARTGIDSWKLTNYLEKAVEKKHVPSIRLLGIIHS